VEYAFELTRMKGDEYFVMFQVVGVANCLALMVNCRFQWRAAIFAVVAPFIIMVISIIVVFILGMLFSTNTKSEILLYCL
jgi:hypothetical protein